MNNKTVGKGEPIGDFCWAVNCIKHNFYVCVYIY